MAKLKQTAHSTAKGKTDKTRAVQKAKPAPVPVKSIWISAQAALAPPRPQRVAATYAGKGKRVRDESSESSTDFSDSTLDPSYRRPLGEAYSDDTDSIDTPVQAPRPAKEAGTQTQGIPAAPPPKKKSKKGNKQSWEEFIATRRFNCERYVGATSFGEDSAIVQKLIWHGLTAWMEKGEGYKPSLVRQFCTAAEDEFDDEVIISADFGDHTVTVSVDMIGTHLGCERPVPSSVEYPHGGYVAKGPQACAEIACIDVNKGDGKLFSSGNLKGDYGAMNNLLFANL